ncbi:MAG: Gfo/Idh/MocA family oxidoreductase [Parachlamydiaceae bacterium]|nr:Gfo/Idh/MocA family oxidoreductase [Parachlamydiaceae bacterium]
MKISKILFIGLGGIGQRHLRNVYSKFGSEISYLAYRERNFNHTITNNLTVEKNVNFIEKYSVEVYSNLSDALLEKPEIAFICNPSSLHIDTCLAVAKSGCDFFVEKPLSHSMEGIEELKSICRSKKLITYVGFQFRFHPCYLLFKKLIEEEIIGNLLSVTAEVGEFLPDMHRYEDYSQLYASRKDLGGGVVVSQIHEIDYLYDLFGKPTKVSAFGGHLSNLEIDVEDVAKVLLQMNFKGRKLPISLHMDYIQKPPSRFCKIIGEEGKITMDITNSRVIIEKPGKDIECHDFSDFERNEMFVKEIDYFFQCVYNRKLPVISIEEGIISLKIALAIKESLESGTTIDF